MIFFVYIFIIVGIYLVDLSALKFKKPKLLCFNDASSGQKLYNNLLTLAQSKTIDQAKDDYKFFNSLIRLVLESSRDLGTPLLPIVAKLKKALLLDIKIEEQIKNLFQNSMLTFLFSMLITWGFLKYSGSMLGLSLALSQILFMAFWQIIGLLTFPILLKKIVNTKLKIYDQFFEKIYIFDLCHMAGISSLEILRKCKFQDLKIKKSDKLAVYLDRLSILVDAKQRFGTQISNDLELLVDELWGSYQADCEALKGFVTIIKFGWLCLFFLSTYLLSLYQIFAGMID